MALFKENEQFKQTRGLIELVSRLLKSVWLKPKEQPVCADRRQDCDGQAVSRRPRQKTAFPASRSHPQNAQIGYYTAHKSKKWID
ncbi:MAG: hypothetical protein Q8M01_10420 [Rubrivivax sp.]|nr:hypothetical protein [Rubrivivax sp.]